MNKILIAIVVLVVAAGAWWKFKPTPSNTTPGNVQTGSGKQNDEFSGTLAQAMKMGVPMKCEWSSTDGSGESYVKGNDVFAKTVVEGKTGMMLKKGDCVYTWSETEKQGVKFCQIALVSPAPETEDNWQPDSGSYQQQGVDLNVEYKCRPDVFSGDRFELPSDVQFLDMESTLKGFTVPQQ